jgi:hypothetical protein
MNWSKPGMPSTVPNLIAAARPAGAQATAIWFAGERLWVRLADGRELGVPLEWFPRLAGAEAVQREHWEVIDQGFGIHWPDLDEDVSVLALLGLPD